MMSRFPVEFLIKLPHWCITLSKTDIIFGTSIQVKVILISVFRSLAMHLEHCNSRSRRLVTGAVKDGA